MMPPQTGPTQVYERDIDTPDAEPETAGGLPFYVTYP
jgi:hypothetical protein